MSKFHSLKVIDVVRETPDAVSVAFEVPANLKQDYKYKQGQYLTIKFNIKGEEDTSPYMQSSIKTLDNTFHYLNSIINESNYNRIIFKIPSKIMELIFSLFYKIKKMDDSGAQKMTIDLKALRKSISLNYALGKSENEMNSNMSYYI